jgi:hypothetical protein
MPSRTGCALNSARRRLKPKASNTIHAAMNPESAPPAPFGARLEETDLPELPEVETVRRGLQPVMEGAVIARVDAAPRGSAVSLSGGFRKTA